MTTRKSLGIMMIHVIPIYMCFQCVMGMSAAVCQRCGIGSCRKNKITPKT